LLLATLRRTGPSHGYALIAALRDGSGGTFDLPEGTIYPALHRLERAGLLSSTWTEVGGRRRRTYSVTAKGKTAANEKRQEWNSFAQMVQRVVGAPPWPATT
jgi:DNA-binding PadR family transcriptional regulator